MAEIGGGTLDKKDPSTHTSRLFCTVQQHVSTRRLERTGRGRKKEKGGEKKV